MRAPHGLMTSSKHHLPKAPSPNTITWEVQTATWVWGGGHKHSAHNTPRGNHLCIHHQMIHQSLALPAFQPEINVIARYSLSCSYCSILCPEDLLLLFCVKFVHFHCYIVFHRSTVLEFMYLSYRCWVVWVELSEPGCHEHSCRMYTLVHLCLGFSRNRPESGRAGLQGVCVFNLHRQHKLLPKEVISRLQLSPEFLLPQILADSLYFQHS